MFLFVDETFLSNYADDTALYSIKKHIFNQSVLKKNFKNEKKEFALKDGTIVSSAVEHVKLGIIIDTHLTLCFRLKQLCKMVASNKVNALARVPPYLNHNQRRLIYNFFFYRTIKLLSIKMLICTFCSR